MAMGLRAWVVSGMLLVGTGFPAAAASVSAPVARTLYKAPGTEAPSWLEPMVMRLAELDTQRFQMEVYQGADGWMVRVLELPEGDEAYRTLEQVYLFPEGEAGKALKAGEVVFEPQGARWKKRVFRLAVREERLLGR